MKSSLTSSRQTIALSVIVMAFLSSCSPELNPAHQYAYAPIGISTPFLKEKKETQLSASFNTGSADEYSEGGSYIWGVSLKGAYAVTNHIGIVAAYSLTREKDKYNTNTDQGQTISYQRNIAEIGCGYFTPISKNQKMVFEIYAGYGLAKNNIQQWYEQNFTKGFYRNHMNKFYLQPAIVMHYKKYFRLGTFIRASYITYNNISTDYTQNVLEDDNVKLFMLNKTQFLFLEPCVSFQFPFSKKANVMGNIQFGRAVKISGPAINYRKDFAGFGLTFNIH